jgi:hypothetical protein
VRLQRRAGAGRSLCQLLNSVSCGGVVAGQWRAEAALIPGGAVLFYNTLRYGMSYQDLGAPYYYEQHRQRVVKGLRRRAKEAA